MASRDVGSAANGCAQATGIVRLHIPESGDGAASTQGTRERLPRSSPALVLGAVAGKLASSFLPGCVKTERRLVRQLGPALVGAERYCWVLLISRERPRSGDVFAHGLQETVKLLASPPCLPPRPARGADRPAPSPTCRSHPAGCA